jgi:hypothetical protein
MSRFSANEHCSELNEYWQYDVDTADCGCDIHFREIIKIKSGSGGS